MRQEIKINIRKIEYQSQRFNKIYITVPQNAYKFKDLSKSRVVYDLFALELFRIFVATKTRNTVLPFFFF